MHLSPSSRRAWIEILRAGTRRPCSVVALLAEGVDRNFVPLEQVIYCRVALLAEGVDRNTLPLQTLPRGYCRPPRGGRG